MNQITGDSLVTRVLFFVALFFVASDLLITLFTIFYQRYWYDRFVRTKFKSPFTPRCAIIVPCKGISKDLEKNLQGFLELDYPDYFIVFAVESGQDAAVGVIKKIMAGNRKAKLAIAGLSTTCVQKNHNLLAGLKMAETAEVYVFADADINPEQSWLRELVLPLGDPGITVTSGFRWLNACKGTLGELAHSYVNIFMYVLFAVACFIGGVGLWGGSMAIRRKDFEELDVAGKWSHASVDDMSLSYLVYKARRKAVIVPHCIIQTDDLLQTVRGTISWFERQIMYLKAYQKNIWVCIAFPVFIVAVLLMFLLPVAFFAGLSSERTFFSAGGGAAAVFYIGELVTVLLYPLLGSMFSFRKFLLYWPLLRFTHAISFSLTVISHSITWAGIKYYLAFNGDVVRIERPGDIT